MPVLLDDEIQEDWGETMDELSEAAAAKNQAQYRGKQARRKLEKEKVTAAAATESVATKLQAQYRGNKERKDYLKKKNLVTKIQKQFREHTDRKKKKEAATMVQSKFRGNKARQKVKDLRKEKQEKIAAKVDELIGLEKSMKENMKKDINQLKTSLEKFKNVEIDENTEEIRKLYNDRSEQNSIEETSEFYKTKITEHVTKIINEISEKMKEIESSTSDKTFAKNTPWSDIVGEDKSTGIKEEIKKLLTDIEQFEKYTDQTKKDQITKIKKELGESTSETASKIIKQAREIVKTEKYITERDKNQKKLNGEDDDKDDDIGDYGHTHFVGGGDARSQKNLQNFIKKWNKFVRQFGSQIVFFASAAQCKTKEECWTSKDYQKMKEKWNGKDTFNDVIKPFSGSISNPFDIADVDPGDHSSDIVDKSLEKARSNLDCIIGDQINDLDKSDQTFILGVTGASGTGKTYVTYERVVEEEEGQKEPKNLLKTIFDILIEKSKPKTGEDKKGENEITIKLDFSLIHAWTEHSTIKDFIYNETGNPRSFDDNPIYEFKHPELENVITSEYKINLEKDNSKEILKEMNTFIEVINKFRIKFDSRKLAENWLEKICMDSYEINFFNGYDTEHFIKEGNRGNENSSRDALITRLLIQIPGKENIYSIYIIDPPGSEKLYVESDVIGEGIKKSVAAKKKENYEFWENLKNDEPNKNLYDKILTHWSKYPLSPIQDINGKIVAKTASPNTSEDILKESRFINISLFALKLYMINGFDYRVKEKYNEWKNNDEKIKIFKYLKKAKAGGLREKLTYRIFYDYLSNIAEGMTYGMLFAKIKAFNKFNEKFQKASRRSRPAKNLFTDINDSKNLDPDEKTWQKAAFTKLGEYKPTNGEQKGTDHRKKYMIGLIDRNMSTTNKEKLDIIKNISEEFVDYIKSLSYTTPIKYFQNNLTFINRFEKKEENTERNPLLVDSFFKKEKYIKEFIAPDLKTKIQLFINKGFSNVYIYNNNSEEERPMEPAQTLNIVEEGKVYTLNPNIKNITYDINDRDVKEKSESPNLDKGHTHPASILNIAKNYNKASKDIYDLSDSQNVQKEIIFKREGAGFYHDFFKEPLLFLNNRQSKETFLETEHNYLNMAKLLFYIGKISPKQQKERKKVIRMLVYTLDVRFTENQRNGDDATDQNVSDRVDVLKKEILNTLFFHTIANDENDTYAAALQRQKESNNNQSNAFKPHQLSLSTSKLGGQRRVKTRKRQKKTKTRKTIKKKYLK